MHRVAGSGRSVFAYAGEIDEWLKTAKSPAPASLSPDNPQVSAPANATRFRRWAIPVGVAALVAAGFAWPRSTPAEDLRVELTPAGVVARDGQGLELWRHLFPATHQVSWPLEAVQVAAGRRPGVYIATSHRSVQAEEQVEGGELTFIDVDGRPRESFSFTDRVAFHGTTYGPSRALSGFAIHETKDSVRVAVTGHHHVWDPGIVTILDEEWRRVGTFVHAGWLEQVRWLSPERLLVAGFSNAHDGGMVTLLDATALAGQGPEPPDSRHFCEDCGDTPPLAMLVFPRSEVNRVAAARFNRARVQTHLGGRLSAHTVEVPSSTGDAAALYEFTPALELLSARFNERYWEMHRSLEAEGKIAHTREACPDRDGPREVVMWDAAGGWRVAPRN